MTPFNLAPRGYGRASFRMTEIIQIGSIPVYLYDDFPWIPYAGSYASISSIGMLGKKGKLQSLVKKIIQISANATKLVEMRNKVLQARPHYTIQGVIEQIALFVREPMGIGPNAGLLRCAPKDQINI